MEEPRELWNSKIGFVLAAAGSAIGLGNIWRFPYMTGENGGFIKNVVLRGIVNGLINIIPIYPIINLLFIFKEDRRCLHDKIAGTYVVHKDSLSSDIIEHQEEY